MSTLPPSFQFSQASLQDYVDCRRRFQLRHLLRLSWPAVDSEPIEEHEAHLQAGEAFHRLIQQHQLGLPVNRLGPYVAAHGSPLTEWWQNYLEHGPGGLPLLRHPEVTLSTPIAGHRLVAKYDLIAVDPGRRALIVDWKTSRFRPNQAWLAARLQTRVYRYILVEAGAELNRGAGLQPAQVAMLYWFANFPEEPQHLSHDDTQHRADARYLSSLVNEIASTEEHGFPRTEEVKQCRFCAYRSLCGRGVEAGRLDSEEAEEEAGPVQERDGAEGFDFEQIAEVEF